jgi:hypothetical protein
MIVPLGFSVERQVDDGWVRVPHPFAALPPSDVGPTRLKPGERIGPHIVGPIYDRYPLRLGLETGLYYRLVKRVRLAGSDRWRRLHGPFTILAAS